jgi:antitoxin HicB
MKTGGLKFDYPFFIRQLSKEDGGGFLIEFLDLPGCISDGETVEEAIVNGHEVVTLWLKTAKKEHRLIPKPNSFKDVSGRWLQRVPI